MKLLTKKSPIVQTLIMGSVLFIFIMIPIWWVFFSWYENRLIDEQKTQDTIELELIKNSISHAMHRRTALFEGLCAYVESNPSEDHLESEINILMTGLHSHAKGVRVLALAPGGIQRYVHPLKDNELVVGHDILHDKRPHIQKAMKRALKTKKIIFNGPYELRQGGLALVVRKAIFLDDKFWGLAAMVIDVPPILEESGFMLKSNYMQLALSDIDGKMFYGDKDIYNLNPLILNVDLLDGHWELAGIPINGWHSFIAGKLRFIQILSFIISLLITTIAALIFFRQKDLKSQIQKKTAELSEQIDAVRNSEERFDLAMRFANDGVYDWNLETNQIYYSTGWKRMLGYEDDELPNDFSVWESLTDPEDVKRSWKMQNELINKKRDRFEMEFKMKHKNGYWVDILSRANAIFDENNKAIRMIGTHVDITERKKNEIALKESDKLYRLVTDNTTDVIWVLDVEENCFRYISPSVKQLLGYTPEELTVSGPIPLFAASSLEYLESESPKRLENYKQGERQIFTDIFEQKQKDGRIVLVENRAKYVLNSDTNRIEAVGVSRDITEKKQLEDRLQQAQKMESIGTLAGGIAHDFNNILGIIVGNTELALDDVPKWNSAHSCLEEIKTASLRAKNIVKQLLSFSRKTDQKLQPIEIGMVIEGALKFLRSTIPTTINIHQDIQTTDEMILADPTQVNQIIMNLCINASHAMEQTGGDLNITVAKVILDDNLVKDYPDLKSGEHVKIMVSDTGPGIDPKIIDQIFDPYFTTKEVGKGSGMGLAVVHGIVISHEGAIAVDSKKGKGTKFSILFPLSTEKPVFEAQANKDIPRGNETILFVDDEISIVNMVQRMFERLGYKVETVTTPQQALDRFALNPDHFDMVITDMTMPQMTGVKLAEKLMDIRPDIPIIICTGHSALVDEEKAKELGLAAYVMKPINMRETAQTIRKILDRNKN